MLTQMMGAQLPNKHGYTARSSAALRPIWLHMCITHLLGRNMWHSCVFAPLDCKTHTSMNEDYGKNCLPNTNQSCCAASCCQVCKCRKGSLAPLHQQVHTHAKLQTTLAMTWKYTYEQQYIWQVRETTLKVWHTKQMDIWSTAFEYWCLQCPPGRSHCLFESRAVCLQMLNCFSML